MYIKRLENCNPLLFYETLTLLIVNAYIKDTKFDSVGYIAEIQGGSNMTGTQCGLFTHKSVPVIFESPCTTL
jgi:hypothetical protein